MDQSDAKGVSLDGFRAELEVFSGPLDLLLHLVKQDEVDILEVSLADVTDRYLAAVRTMQAFDVNVAAEFLVVAATLMEVKSRSLLPPLELDDDEDEEDPGTELVRRLLEYKEFREAADDLGARAQERADRFARPRMTPAVPGDEDAGPAALLEDLATWDLMAAFARVLSQTTLRQSRHVVRGELPVSAYIEEVAARLRLSPGGVAFADFFREELTRTRVVGIFLALLELIRRRAIEVRQPRDDTRRLWISLRPGQ